MKNKYMNSFIIITLLFCNFIAFGFRKMKCPEADEIHRYVVSQNDDSNFTGMKVYYQLLKPYDENKETVLVINGGPGGNHSLIHAFKHFEGIYNIVGFDHRGLGCTSPLTPLDSRYKPSLYSIKAASYDIDAIRKDLVGDKGKIFIYGISYGGMLGQAYLTNFDDNIKGAIIDSTFHKSEFNEVARRVFVKRFLEEEPNNQELYKQVVEKYPDSKKYIQWASFSKSYSYLGRTAGIPKYLNEILSADTNEDAEKIYKNDIVPSPNWGMRAGIVCEEIWDDSSDISHMPTIALECPKYKNFRKGMNFSDGLKKLKTPVFLWSGNFDPVTPVEGMREMKTLIPNVIEFNNKHSGHGLFREKPRCTREIMTLFINGKKNSEILEIANSKECQREPQKSDLESFNEINSTIKSFPY